MSTTKMSKFCFPFLGIQIKFRRGWLSFINPPECWVRPERVEGTIESIVAIGDLSQIYLWTEYSTTYAFFTDWTAVSTCWTYTATTVAIIAIDSLRHYRANSIGVLVIALYAGRADWHSPTLASNTRSFLRTEFVPFARMIADILMLER